MASSMLKARRWVAKPGKTETPDNPDGPSGVFCLPEGYEPEGSCPPTMSSIKLGPSKVKISHADFSPSPAVREGLAWLR